MIGLQSETELVWPTPRAGVEAGPARRRVVMATFTVRVLT